MHTENVLGLWLTVYGCKLAHVLCTALGLVGISWVSVRVTMEKTLDSWSCKDTAPNPGTWCGNLVTARELGVVVRGGSSALSVFWALKHLRWAGLTVPPNSEVSWGHVPVSSVDSQGCHEWAPCAYCCAALWVLGAQDCWCVLYDGDCSMNANNIKFGWGLASAEL